MAESEIKDIRLAFKQLIECLAYCHQTEEETGYKLIKTYLALPDNARIQVSGTFSDYFNAYSAHQVYNLRGDGGYEYRVFH